jgi:type IV pilus assembly protein PilN
MIKINLLPKDISNERSLIELIVLISIIAIAVVGGMYYYYHMNVKVIEEKLAEKAKKEKELTSLQQVKLELEKQKEIETKLKRKYAHIDRLNKRRVGPVRLLNVVAESLQGTEMLKSPDGQIRAISAWINNLENPGNVLSLNGLALDYSEIANFMSSLESHKEIKDVKLTSSQKQVNEGNELVSFKIECQTDF